MPSDGPVFSTYIESLVEVKVTGYAGSKKYVCAVEIQSLAITVVLFPTPNAPLLFGTA